MALLSVWRQARSFCCLCGSKLIVFLCYACVAISLCVCIKPVGLYLFDHACEAASLWFYRACMALSLCFKKKRQQVLFCSMPVWR